MFRFNRNLNKHPIINDVIKGGSAGLVIVYFAVLATALANYNFPAFSVIFFDNVGFANLAIIGAAFTACLRCYFCSKRAYPAI